ncbi:hypothetical protein FB446DRAFT_766013 [Lentinula raphanica]|nr:hypothetical protein FB446DRAFT_766013 [Lentinula raphanica]
MILGYTSGYLGRERVDKKTKRLRRVYALDDLVGEHSKWKFKVLKADLQSIGPTLITDINSRVFITRIPPPVGDPTFPQDAAQAAAVLEEYRPYLFNANKPGKKHRRGDFPVAPIGISFGGGQNRPKRIYHPSLELNALEKIRGLPCFSRLAGHATKAFAAWSPNLYSFYVGYMQRLSTMVPDILFNWKSSIFACCTLNFGPQTTTIKHLNHMNYIYGWCCITALGDFDFRRGGHLVLWDLGLVVEFPPGWTILIPSAFLLHSNTHIAPGETRYSMTQYTAAGLFRIIDDDGVPRKKMTPEELHFSEERQRARITEALDRYTTIEELLDMD